MGHRNGSDALSQGFVVLGDRVQESFPAVPGGGAISTAISSWETRKQGFCIVEPLAAYEELARKIFLELH